jgi:hypothetical protein
MILRVADPNAARQVLDAEHAAFVLLPGISMTAASRGDGNLPELGRVHGCRVAADRSRVTVFLPADQYPGLIGALRASRAIAVVFSQPATHRTIQLKGTDARLEPLAPGDAERAAQATDSFAAGLGALGYNETMVRAAVWYEPSALVAVGFTPCAAFQQTPGPRAGAPLAA